MKRRAPLVLLAMAAAALGSAAYLASFCVLLENECHLDHAAACERLSLYLSAAAGTIVLGLVAGLGSGVTYAITRRRSPSSTVERGFVGARIDPRPSARM